jgi:hypothetical protein
MYMLAVEAYSRGQIAKGWPVLLEDVIAHLKASRIDDCVSTIRRLQR